MKHHLLIPSIYLGSLLGLFGQNTPAEKPRIPKVPALALEWRDFEAKAWETAGQFNDFKLATGESNAPVASQPTEVRLAHDGVNLYIRFTATDSDLAKQKTSPPPFDDFERNFPRGDHAEIWIQTRGALIFAFDKNGNKYEANNYDQDFFSGFRTETRTTASGWETVLKIPMQNFLDVLKPPKAIRISLIRHIDHGDGKPERSSVAGTRDDRMNPVEVEW